MKYLDTEIRPITEADIPQVLEIERLCFSDPRNEENIRYEMYDNPFANFWVIELSNASLGLKQICGFCDYWHTFDSATINQIAVHPELHHMHLGSEMMEEIIKDAKIKKIRTITLEVRKSNSNAIKLYEKYGFVLSHIKEGYYQDNGEDALYMILEVK